MVGINFIQSQEATLNSGGHQGPTGLTLKTTILVYLNGLLLYVRKSNLGMWL